MATNPELSVAVIQTLPVEVNQLIGMLTVQRDDARSLAAQHEAELALQKPVVDAAVAWRGTYAPFALASAVYEYRHALTEVQS